MTPDDEKRLDAIADEIVGRIVSAMVEVAALKAETDPKLMVAHNTGVVCQQRHERGELAESEVAEVVKRVEFRLSDLAGDEAS